MDINIVALDGYTLNPGDLSWEGLEALGNFTVYDRSKPEEVIPRSIEADILLSNKVLLSKSTLDQLPRLKYICVTATGYNNVDIQAAAERKIPVSNVVGYSTQSVAQHVFALLLALTNKIERHSISVKQDDWSRAPDFCYTLSPIPELFGKTFGIYGFGRIGQEVAKIAQAFGMEVLATHKHPERDAQPGVKFVNLPTLFQQSDVLSLHAPLSDQNFGIVNTQMLSSMKPSAYLLNTGRGGLINEVDLKSALLNKVIAGAALDVLGQEPPLPGHPLLEVENCIITPHIAWISKAARQRLMDTTVKNVKAFIEGYTIDTVNGL